MGCLNCNGCCERRHLVNVSCTSKQSRWPSQDIQTCKLFVFSFSVDSLRDKRRLLAPLPRCFGDLRQLFNVKSPLVVFFPWSLPSHSHRSEWRFDVSLQRVWYVCGELINCHEGERPDRRGSSANSCRHIFPPLHSGLYNVAFVFWVLSKADREEALGMCLRGDKCWTWPRNHMRVLRKMFLQLLNGWIQRPTDELCYLDEFD